MTRALTLILALTFVCGCSRELRYGAAVEASAETLVTETALMEIVERLASDEMDGRLAGTPGHQAAAEYAASRFARLGLLPGGDDGYLQHFVLEANEIGGEVELGVVSAAGAVEALEHGDDFVARGFTGSGEVTAPVVFCGYGLSLPEQGWDDYAGVDVRGKVVLAFKQAPSFEIDGVDWGESWYPRPKANAAAQKGAVALLLVSVPDAERPQPLIGSVLHGPGEHPLAMPQLHITEAVADTLLATTSTTLSQVQTEIDEERQPRPIELDASVQMRVQANHDPARGTANVVAVLPGSDESLGDEHVILGAHLDHIGRQGALMYPGANDNASGSAAVMTAAAALVRGDFKPRRTVVFVLFSGEEQGLLGAKAFVADPPLPLDRAVAMINVDCVGMGDGLHLGGGGASPALIGLAEAINARATTLEPGDTGYGGWADAEPFFDAGIPTLSVATRNGWHHLHRPTDRPEALDPRLFTAASRVVFLATAAVADGEYVAREPRQPRDEG